jgi:hypothetical protein
MIYYKEAQETIFTTGYWKVNKLHKDIGHLVQVTYGDICGYHIYYCMGVHNKDLQGFSRTVTPYMTAQDHLV